VHGKDRDKAELPQSLNKYFWRALEVLQALGYEIELNSRDLWDQELSYPLCALLA
jgi:hypothetical protein